MLRFMKAAFILLILTTVTVMAQSPAVSVAVTPSTVIVMNEEITFTATARTANPNCTRVAFSYSLLSSPIPATGFPPVFGSSAQATTTVNRITVAGLYVFQLTVTDNCQTPPATTILPLNVRALGGTYDTAVVRVAVDAAGTFNWNGLAPSGVTGFMDGQTLTVSVPNVAPGDVFSIIGKNLPTATATAPNPAMVAATIRWRDMDFNTSPTTWQCTNGNLTQTNGNNNWMMKPGNNPVLPVAVSQGSNAPGSVWAALNNNNILGGVAPEAQFLWTQSTLNFPAADASVVSCRSVFTPPPEIVTGLVIVSSVPTVPPTLPPTLPPTTPPTIPPTTAVQPTTPPTVLPTTFAPTTATPVAGAGQNGAATTTAGGGTKLNPLFIVIPVVIVAAIIALIWIIRQRRKSLTPTPISKLSEMV